MRIIFSRDRACQLDALLCSIERFWPGDELGDVVVIWRATDEVFDRGYVAYQLDHLRVGWIEERGDLKTRLEPLIAEDPLVCFFTDDSVLYRPIDDSCAKTIQECSYIVSFSLRYGMNTTYCHPLGREMTQPKWWGIERLTWDWQGGDADFGYPLALDGHIMRSADLLAILSGKDYANPNQLEDLLASAAREGLPRHFMASYDHSRYVSLPINRVNETHPNNAGLEHPASVEELNARYLAGERIDISKMDFSAINGAHQELELAWRKA